MPAAPPALARALHALDKATERAQTGLRVFAVFRELQRRDVVEAIKSSVGSKGAAILVRSMIRDLVVCCAALHDDHVGATNVGSIVNTILHPDHRGMLTDFHRTWLRPPSSDRLFADLGRRARRLKKAPVRPARDRLEDLRNKAVAHSDVFPGFPRGDAIFLDIPLVLLKTASVVQHAHLVATGRGFDLLSIGREASAHGRDFAGAIMAGVQTK